MLDVELRKMSVAPPVRESIRPPRELEVVDLRRGGIGARLLEPRMRLADVIEDAVEDEPEAALFERRGEA
jgi:hypothetical protein